MEPNQQTSLPNEQPIERSPLLDSSPPTAIIPPEPVLMPPKTSRYKFLTHKKVWIPLVAIVVLGAAAASYLLVFKKEATPPKVYHVGILSCYDYFKPVADGFKKGLTDLGYTEGKNVTYDVQTCATETETDIQPVIQKFINDKADVVVVSPTQATITVKKLLSQTNIPLIFGSAFTEGNNLIASVSQPGGNITGVRWPSSAELDLSNLQVYHQLAPNVKRLWLPYKKDDPLVQSQLDALRPAAATLGITLIELAANNTDEVRAYLTSQENQKDISMDGITTIADSLSSTTDFKDLIGNFADKHNIPISYGNADSTLFALAPDATKSGKQAAGLADKIFKGAQAGTIPVVSVDNNFTINYKIATKLGLTIPDSLLSQADSVTR